MGTEDVISKCVIQGSEGVIWVLTVLYKGVKVLYGH